MVGPCFKRAERVYVYVKERMGMLDAIFPEFGSIGAAW